ncbi:MAG: hypothetical protein KDH88_02845 [Chromatiales bacterium]|nr:hypothetical protein [Chromatiales bacterium]
MIHTEINEDDEPTIKRLKARLRKKFNPDKEGDVDSAVRLANYLVAVGRMDEAAQILEGLLRFSYRELPEKVQHVWPANAQGLVLLSYIDEFENDRERKSVPIRGVLNNDYNLSEHETHFQKLLYDYRNNEWIMKIYGEESCKFRCEMLSQECLTFLYWRQTWGEILFLEAQRFEDEQEKIDGIIKVVYEKLKDEIVKCK